MNAPRVVLSTLNLTPESQGPFAVAYLAVALLADAEDANPVAATYSDPFRETLFRLKPYRDSFGYQTIAKLLTTKIK